MRILGTTDVAGRLDEETRSEIVGLLESVRRERGLTLVVAQSADALGDGCLEAVPP